MDGPFLLSGLAAEAVLLPGILAVIRSAPEISTDQAISSVDRRLIAGKAHQNLGTLFGGPRFFSSASIGVFFHGYPDRDGQHGRPEALF